MTTLTQATGPKLVFVIPANADNDVLAYFQERMPYGIAVPDIGDLAPAQRGRD